MIQHKIMEMDQLLLDTQKKGTFIKTVIPKVTFKFNTHKAN
jgi:hypothetical protein